ncbi:MAG TPA: hypothetical protein VIM90_10070 [Arenimonas sp.]
MKVRNLFFAGAIAATTLLLSACATTWKVSGSCETGGKCKVTGEIGGTFEKSAGSIDVSQLTISVASTASLPLSGMVTVHAKNSAGATVGTSSFPWTRSGATLTISNPAAANAWLNSVPNATTAAFNLDPMQTIEQPGFNSLDVTLSYAGVPKAFQSTGWTSANTGCRIGYCREK